MSVSDYEQQPEEKHKLQPNIQLNDITHMMSSPNYLVNLSSLNSTNLCKLNRTNKLNLPYSHYDKLLNVVASMSGRHTSTDTHTHHKHQNCKCGQPRHHSLNPSYPSTNTTATKRISPSKASCYLNNFIKRPIERVHSRSKLYESKFEQSPSLKKHSKKISRIILSHTNSPHYLKHQNRQENQARAMAQVVRWLEKEVSTNVTIKNRLEKKLGKNKSKPHCISDKKTPVHFKVTNPNLKYTQRHKHHHVHKYIHHHYHHF